MKANRLQLELLRQLLDQLKQRGVEPNQVFRAAGLSGPMTHEQAADIFVSPLALGILESTVELTGDPCLPMRLSDNIHIDSYGTLGFALMSCESLRQSTKLLFRYGKLVFPQLWQSHNDGDNLLLRIDVPIGTPCQQRLLKELFLTNIYRASRLLNRGAIEGVTLQLDYPAPAHIDCYRVALPVPTTFDCEYTQLYIPGATLDKAISTADPAEHVIFHRQCEEMLRELEHSGEITTKVRRALIQSAGNFPDISEVAERLHMSERTLRRYLDSESTTFRAVLDDIRNLLAKEYLADTLLAVADIAHVLDYNETVNFRRAFKRWNGLTPSEYRQQASVRDSI